VPRACVRRRSSHLPFEEPATAVVLNGPGTISKLPAKATHVLDFISEYDPLAALSTRDPSTPTRPAPPGWKHAERNSTTRQIPGDRSVSDGPTKPVRLEPLLAKVSYLNHCKHCFMRRGLSSMPSGKRCVCSRPISKPRHNLGRCPRDHFLPLPPWQSSFPGNP